MLAYGVHGIADAALIPIQKLDALNGHKPRAVVLDR